LHPHQMHNHFNTHMRKSLLGTISSALLLFTIIIAESGCSKTPKSTTNVTLPLVVTVNVISNLTQTTAQSGGIVTNSDGGEILTNGVCYSTTDQTPTIADAKTTDTVNVLGWTSRLTGLTPGTTYYVRAYATNVSGAGYGAVIKFTTSTTSNNLVTNVTTVAGNTGGSYGYMDGLGASILFNGPQALGFNPITGNIYIADALNNLIRTMTTAGQVSTLTNPTLGYVNGALSTALFYGPRSIAFDAQGNCYIADLGNDVIRKITTAGVVSTLAGNGTQGYADGPGAVAEFRNPEGIAVDPQGNVYVADNGNNLIRKITPAGVVSSFVGFLESEALTTTTSIAIPLPGYADGTTSAAAFNSPVAVACDAQGNVYIADNNNRAIRVATPAGVVTTLAGNPVQKNVVGAPVALACDAQGDLFIADASGRILEITAAKVLYTLAGTFNVSGYVDGAGTAALFNDPSGVTVDTQGNVYVGDFYNNVIRKITVKFQ